MYQGVGVFIVAFKSKDSYNGVMYKLKYIFLGVFFGLLGCNTYQVPMVANYQQIPVIHVQKNDTLYSLAKRYDTTAEELARHNAIEDPTELQPGQSLTVPRSAPKTKPATTTQKATDSLATKSQKTIQKPAASVTQRSKTSKSSAQVVVKSNSSGAKISTPKQTVRQTTKTAQPLKKVASQKTVPQTTKLKKPFVAKGKVNFAWPLKGNIISNYGGKGHGVKNDGINIGAKKGTPIKASESGIVVYAGNELKGYGNLILLKHEKNFMTAYAHADQLMVDVGDVVDKGQKIATVGQTGNVKSPQLHFEVRQKTKAVDPKKHLH